MNKVVGALLSVALLAGTLPAKTTNSSGKKKTGTTHKTSSSSSAKSTSHSKSTTASRSKRSTARVQSTKAGKHGRKGARTKKIRGQQSIDSERAREIQAALIREHYLDGEPSGSFDQRTKSALQKFQQDNGWQTKVIPDSRALIKLGLGPSKDGLLNPESAAMASPHQLGVEREIPGGAMVSAQRK